ncbi:MAG TPA: energy transducer TonB [Acidobacteriaceae bacterium]|jgi:TonB family protein|nr:energy transducer TonB [Acidobacteriaceae bacterium]
MSEATMSWSRAAALAVGFVLGSASIARADDSAKLMDRLHAAAAATALDTSDMKPWHLKLSVRLFDSSGKPVDEGSIEEWWGSPELNRTEYKTNSYSATEIRNEGNLYRTKGASLPPYYLNLLRRQIVHPLPHWSSDEPSSKLYLRKLKVSKTPLVCIELGSSPGREPSPLGAVPTYCFGTGTDSLRMSVRLQNEVIARNSIGHFAGHEVPADVAVSTNSVVTARAHIDALANSEISQSVFDPSDDTPEVTPPIVDGDGIKLKLVSEAYPLYPAQAKASHISSGIVVTRAIIGTNGAVRKVEVISSSSPLLVSAAMDAVQQWKYQPYETNGIPAEVVIEIVMAFSLGP